MQMFIKKQIGKTPYSFVVEGSTLYEVVTQSQKLSFPDVHKCGKCGSNNLFLNAREAGEKGKYEYVEIKCRDCKAQLQFGQTTADKEVYYLRKRDAENGEGKEFDWKIYDASSNSYIQE